MRLCRVGLSMYGVVSEMYGVVLSSKWCCVLFFFLVYVALFMVLCCLAYGVVLCISYCVVWCMLWCTVFCGMLSCGHIAVHCAVLNVV